MLSVTVESALPIGVGADLRDPLDLPLAEARFG